MENAVNLVFPYPLQEGGNEKTILKICERVDRKRGPRQGKEGEHITSSKNFPNFKKIEKSKEEWEIQ